MGCLRPVSRRPLPGLLVLLGVLAPALVTGCTTGRVETAGGRAPEGAAAPIRRGGEPAPGPDSIRITLMGTTDLHGRVYPVDHVTGALDPGGLAAIATLVDSIRAADDYTLLVDSGDLLQGNPFAFYFARVDSTFAATGGVHPVIAAMNALGYDVSAIGNHEFDFGLPALRRALAGARFPFVAANVTHAGTSDPVWPPYAIVTVGPVRIGLIGFTTPGVMVWSRERIAGQLEVGDIVAAADRWLPRLAAERPDLIVATIHSGLGPESSYATSLGVALEDAVRPLAERHPEIDVVFFGHTHRDTPEERINGVLLTQAEKWGERLAVAHVTLRRAPGAERYGVVAKASHTLATGQVPPSRRIVDLLEPAHQAVAGYVRSPIGRSTAVWSARAARLEDTPIVDLVQRVQLDATGADLSATAAFTTAARLPEGEVTFADVAGLYVYENTLKAIRITGRQLRDYLEASARYFRRVCPGGRPAPPGDDRCDAVAGADASVGVVEAAGPAAAAGAAVAGAAGVSADTPEAPLTDPEIPGYNYDIVAGADYVIDLSRPVGSRVTELTYRGEPVRDDQTFTLALNGYRQGGGGGFDMLAGAPVVYDRGEEVRQLILDWVRERGTLRPEDVFEANWRLEPAVAIAPYLEAARRGGAGQACAWAQAAEADSLVHLTVLATNDLHGGLQGKEYPWSEGRTVGGAAALAGYIARERARNPEGTILLDGGDVMQGTPISNLVKGESSIAFFNQIGYDAAAIGNHEFDWGIETLEARVLQARFPFLSANVFERGDGGSSQPPRRPRWTRPTALLERKGVKVGLIGLTTESTPETTLPTNVAHLQFSDLAGAVAATVPELERAGADLLVVVAHAGGFYNPDSALYRGEIVEAMRRMSPAVDLVVSGHTHTLLHGEVNGIPLVQARSAGTALGIVDLWVDPRRDAVACADVNVINTFADSAPPAPEVAALVERYRQQVGTIAERVIATAAHRLTTDRRRESILGDMIADAQRAAVATQIALMNSGGIRTEIDAGPIAWREAYEVQPFANILYRIAIDGRTLKEALELGVSGEHGLIQVSGIRFVADFAAPVGERVRDLTLEDGATVHPDSVYTVAVNNFLAQGGDGYTMLRDAPAVTNTGLIDTDVFVEYLKGQRQPIRYALKNRIRLLNAPAPGTAASPAVREADAD